MYLVIRHKLYTQLLSIVAQDLYENVYSKKNEIYTC